MLHGVVNITLVYVLTVATTNLDINIARLSRVSRLFLGSVHCQGVQQSSEDGNTGTDDGSSAHGGLEGDHGGDNDDDTLDGVSNGVGHRVDLSEGKEGDLIVGIIRSATKSEQSSKALLGEVSSGDSHIHSLEAASSLNAKGEWDEDHGGHESEDGVKVLGVEVLSDLLSGHGLLRKNTTGGRRDVGEHGRGKGQDSKGKFLHGCDSNSSDDGKQCKVNRKRQDLSKKEGVQSTSDNRLGCLDDVSKRDGTSSEGDDSTNVNTSVAKGNRDEGLDLRGVEFGGFADSQKPERNEVSNTGGHLHGGNGPWVGEGVQRLLVVDIVSNVEKVPQSEVRGNLKSVLEASSLGFFSRNGLSSSTGGEGEGRRRLHSPERSKREVR